MDINFDITSKLPEDYTRVSKFLIVMCIIGSLLSLYPPTDAPNILGIDLVQIPTSHLIAIMGAGIGVSVVRLFLSAKDAMHSINGGLMQLEDGHRLAMELLSAEPSSSALRTKSAEVCWGSFTRALESTLVEICRRDQSQLPELSTIRAEMQHIRKILPEFQSKVESQLKRAVEIAEAGHTKKQVDFALPWLALYFYLASIANYFWSGRDALIPTVAVLYGLFSFILLHILIQNSRARSLDSLRCRMKRLGPVQLVSQDRDPE